MTSQGSGPSLEVDYTPGDIETDLGIGLVGCGNVSEAHLRGHRAAGYDVPVLCDIEKDRAIDRREEFYPDADVTTDYQDLLNREDVHVLDIAVPPEVREEIMFDALEAGRHVRSEKPFTTDIGVAEQLVELAERKGLKLAVNQTRRWRRSITYIRHAVDEGLIGDPMAVLLVSRRDYGHHVDRGMPYSTLYNGGVHYFDIAACLMGERDPTRVYASVEPSPRYEDGDPRLSHAAVDYDSAQVTFRSDMDTKHASEDHTHVIGTEGTISSRRGDEGLLVTLTNEEGVFQRDVAPAINRHHASMAELLAAIEEDREPYHSGRNNLRTLELTFAAVASAHDGTPKVPGEVRTLPDAALRSHLQSE